MSTERMNTDSKTKTPMKKLEKMMKIQNVLNIKNIVNNHSELHALSVVGSVMHFILFDGSKKPVFSSCMRSVIQYCVLFISVYSFVNSSARPSSSTF